MSTPEVSVLPTEVSPARVSGARPVRVCFMIDRLKMAGTETQLVALIRNLDRTRVQPFLCLLDGMSDESRAMEPEDCPVLRLGILSIHHPSTVGRSIRLAQFLRGNRIDVMQVYVHDSTYLGVLVARFSGIRFVIRTRNNLGHDLTPTRRWLNRLYKHFVTATVANSEPCRQSILTDEGPSPGPILVLENGVDLARFPLNPPRPCSTHRGGGRRRVGVVANLRHVKGLDLLVKAAALLRDTHPDLVFEVAGEGEFRPMLERMVSELALENRFLMPGTSSDIPGFLSGLDVAVLCSRSEGMPNALLEYMAAGKPIVATVVGPVTDLIEDGVHGLVVPPDDPLQLASAINRLLTDPGLAKTLGEAARRQVCERYSRQAMVQRFEDFYQRLVNPSCDLVAVEGN